MKKQSEKTEKIISQFNKQEIFRIKKFLNSPYFNQREDVKVLFEIIVSEPEITQMEAFSRLFPGDSYDNQKLRLVRSYLFRLIEKYLLIREFSEDELAASYYLTKAYRKRGLTDAFKKSYEKALYDLDNQSDRNARYYEYAYHLQWERHLLTSADSPSEAKNLLEMSDTIDLSYLSLKLKNICLLAAHQSVYNATLQPQLADEVLQHVQKNDLLNIPAVSIYYYGYRMFENKTAEDYFKKFKLLVLQNGSLFPRDEIRDLYLMAINYCVRQLNDGDEFYFREAFELYKEGLENEYLLENGVLSRFAYHNVVAIGLKIGEFNWVAFFIQRYKNALERKYRDSSFSFNTARLELSRKNYGAVLELLQKANYRDLLLNLTAKTLLLKTYYELGETNLLYAHLDAMNNYIRRKGIIGYHKTNFQNIVRYTRKLANTNPYDKVEKSTLAKMIEKEEVLTEKKWLLSMIGMG